jgi:hypothetical protein
VRTLMLPIPYATGAELALGLSVQDEKACAVCLDRPRDTAAQPCEHLALCEQCALRLTAEALGSEAPDPKAAPGDLRCVVCRRQVEQLLVLRRCAGP